MNSKFFVPVLGADDHPLRLGYLNTQSEYPSLHSGEDHQHYVQCIRTRDRLAADGLAVPIWLTLRIEALAMLNTAERLYKNSFRLEEAYHLAHYPDEQRFEEECINDQETGDRLPLSAYVALPPRDRSPSFRPTPSRVEIRSGPSSSVRVTAPHVIVISSASSASSSSSSSPDLRTPPSSPEGNNGIRLRVPLPDSLVLNSDLDSSNDEPIEQLSGRPCSPTQHVSQLPVDSDEDNEIVRFNTPPIEILTTDDEAWIVTNKKGKNIRRSRKMSSLYSPY